MKKRAMREAKKKMQKKMKRRGKKKNTMKEILLEKKKRTEGVTTRKNMKHEVANDVDRPRLPILRDAAAMSNQQNDRRYLGTPVELTTNYIQTAIYLLEMNRLTLLLFRQIKQEEADKPESDGSELDHAVGS